MSREAVWYVIDLADDSVVGTAHSEEMAEAMVGDIAEAACRDADDFHIATGWQERTS